MQKTSSEASQPSSADQDHTILMQWQTPAYLRQEKSRWWYLLMGIIVLGFIVYGLLYDAEAYSWIVSVTFVLLVGVYALQEMKPVSTLLVQISDHGIRYGARYFDYQQIRSFWITSEDSIKILHLQLYRGVPKEISIYLTNDVSVPQLRQMLQLQIQEEEGKKERFTDQLIRNIGL